MDSGTDSQHPTSKDKKRPGAGLSVACAEPPASCPLVRLDRVSLRFGDIELFSRLCLSVPKGGHLALTGANGAGKSTLLRLMQGELRLPHVPADRELSEEEKAGSLPEGHPGRVYWGFSGVEDPSALGPREHARLVSPAQQRNYLRQGWDISGEEIILSGLDNAPMVYGELSESLYARAALLAEESGAAHLLQAHAPALSQGQLRLMLILRALISGPALLLLDEPFDGLDARSRAQVLSAVELAAHKGSTLVVSAHRAADIPPFIHTTLRLKDGKADRSAFGPDACAKGRDLQCAEPAPGPAGTQDGPEITPAGAGEPPSHERSAEGKASENPRTWFDNIGGEEHDAACVGSKGTRAIGPPGACSRWALTPPVPGFAGLPQSGFADALARKRQPLLRLLGVDVFIDRALVLRNISWTVRFGEQWLVSGPNGSGKSTLLRLLYGDEFAAFGGELRWCGGPRPALDELRASVAYVSDRLQHEYDHDLQAEEVVISGLRGSIGLYAGARDEERALARLWLERMGVGPLAGRTFHSLSSGQARRVLLARALASSPPVLLLDEPCSGLDRPGRERFLSALPLLAARGVSIIMVSHHEGDKTRLFTHELRLIDGEVQYVGPR
ncbi:ATP-binding cassette domain-containing protein [Desulfovibrio sp. OttesenSCG-928-A18]|nr:ATP-binding cassette domain-containing protein [Desulfovibrio sp. OttesenSCG-928-A18]